ncbi:DUF1513 domain-containing protein [Glaciecola sp. 33A]|jgi:hypothetical protein|uniref:DUF1513 domain-containing protein n=1 Tax=Glaciecola sp. 33A TaxID=2057807 RepID=UPI000C342C95|nr:DUF1513 domain-containing protein [Glaciecola sp. 33A]PKI03078.1 DUF1513 domain-containing protein [Glaciecola sp. 33A]
MNRRQFLLGSTQLAFASWALSGCQKLGSSTWLVSAVKDNDGKFAVVAIDHAGKLINKIALPERGHDLLALPRKPGHAIVFSRRPDRFAIEVNFAEGKVVDSFTSQNDSHFYGHGVLSSDGNFLFTSENLYEAKQGVLVVRNTDNYAVEARFNSHGIGPHQLKLMPDNKTLVIANGGILTHPDFPRLKLNLDSMQSNLAYINSQNGELLNLVEPLNKHQSLRHLDVSLKGDVIVGAQYQGKNNQVQPLVFLHRQGNQMLTEFEATQEQWRDMQQYTASILVAGKQAYVTCPRGDNLYFMDIEAHKILNSQKISDCAGIAKSSLGITVSNGFGQITSIKGQVNNPQVNNHQFKGLHFDNHMITIDSA